VTKGLIYICISPLCSIY